MKKTFYLFLIALLSLLIFVPRVSADTNLTVTEAGEARTDYDDNGNLSVEGTTVPFVTQANLAAFVCMMGDFRACTSDPEKQNGYFRQSVVGKINEGIALTYLNPPANTGTYLADLGMRAGIVKPAYAQGIGFSGLTPLLGIWKAFRNIAYGFLILVLVAVGFMIIFRMKIDPRTVISIQNALPRIVITLILITFSYAIIGLFIDAMYLSLFLVTAVLQSAVGISAGQFPQLLQIATGGPLADLYGSLWPVGQAAVDDIVVMIGGATINNILSILLPLVGAYIGGGDLKGIIALGTVGAAEVAAGGGGNLLVTAIVWIAIIFTLIRIFFMLVGAYIQIIISVIFGPLQIMFGAIPNTDAFGSWLRNVIANLVVFPVTSAMLMIGAVLAALAGTQNLWAPPGLGGTGLQAGVSGIIGLGIAFSIPTVANTIKELLKAKPVVPGGPGAIFTPLTSIYGTAMGGISNVYYLSQLTGEHGLLSKFFRRK